MPTRKSGGGRTSGATEPSLPDRRLMEQQMSAITRLLAEREFGSIEEANAYLREALVQGILPTPAPTTPLEEAQEVIYQALVLQRRLCKTAVFSGKSRLMSRLCWPSAPVIAAIRVSRSSTKAALRSYWKNPSL